MVDDFGGLDVVFICWFVYDGLDGLYLDVVLELLGEGLVFLGYGFLCLVVFIVEYGGFDLFF